MQTTDRCGVGGDAPARLRWELVALSALALLLYLPAMRFGLIWDDPTWYALGGALPKWRLLGPMPAFQFYRPLTLLYNRLFVRADGTVLVELQHVLQALYHAANAVLCVALAERCGLARWSAVLAGLIMAVHPYAQQAVAWQAPQQPLVTLLLLLVVLGALLYRDTGQARWRLLSCAAFACGLLVQEVMLAAAALMVLVYAEQQRPWMCWRRLWPYGAIAALFVLLYVSMPKKPGIVGVDQQVRVAAFLLQSLSPPTGLPQSLVRGRVWWWLLALVVLLGVLALVSARRSRRASTLGLVWLLAAISPALLGLRWDYVETGARLAYPALPGVALLWAAALSCGVESARAWRLPWPRLLGLALVLTLGWQTLRLQRLWIEATALQQSAVAAIAARPDETLLFVNYPDQVALKRPPYALGYWGVILAPPVQALADYARSLEGVAGATDDIARLDVGVVQWQSSPYEVLLRGRRVSAQQSVPRWRAYDVVYATVVSPQGRFALREVGWVAAADNDSLLATFNETLVVRSAEVDAQQGHVRVLVALEGMASMRPNDVLFLHLLTPDGVLVRGADDDLWGGFVPIEALPRGVTVGEVREIDTAGLAPGDYAVTIGLYNRSSGERYRALHANGFEAWNGELQVGTLRIH